MAATANSNPSATTAQSLYLQDMGEVKRVFNRFDANSDGKISAAELADVMKALGSNTSPEEVSRMMVEIDTDRDGFINLEEFAGFCKSGEGDPNGDGGVQELKEAFELYDINKNGLISSAELHQILTQLGEICTEADCVKMIQTVDSDGDGYVNFEEFKSMMSNTSKGSDLVS